MLPPIKKVFIFNLSTSFFYSTTPIEHSMCQLEKQAENAFKQGFRPLSRIQKL